MRKIEVPTHTPTELQLLTCRGGGRRENRGRRPRNKREEREEVRRVETPHSQTAEAVAEKRPKN